MTQFEQNTPEATAHQNYYGYYDHLDCILEKNSTETEIYNIE